MLSLLNRTCRGIEDAWTAGFIQLFILAILGYTVVNNVVQHFDNVRMETRLEDKYNKENGTDIHLNGVGPPTFDLAESLWQNAPQLIVVAFVIAYEVRRRRRIRSRPVAQGDHAPDAPAQGSGGSLPGVALGLLRVGWFLACILMVGWFAAWALRIARYLAEREIAWAHPELADVIAHRPQNSLAVDAMWAIVWGIGFLALVWASVSLERRRTRKAGGGSSAKQRKAVQ